RRRSGRGLVGHDDRWRDTTVQSRRCRLGRRYLALQGAHYGRRRQAWPPHDCSLMTLSIPAFTASTDPQRTDGKHKIDDTLRRAALTHKVPSAIVVNAHTERRAGNGAGPWITGKSAHSSTSSRWRTGSTPMTSGGCVTCS